MKRIIYLIIILILILKKIKLYITIPFEIDNLSLNLNDEEFMRNLFFNELYINISIGSLKQNIPLKIKSTSQLSYTITGNVRYFLDTTTGLMVFYGSGALNAIKTGLEDAHGEYVVVTMADLCDPPEVINEMVAAAERENADIVCASRYMKGGRQIGGPKLKGFLSRAAGFLLYKLTRLPTHDPTNSFKLYRKSFLKEVTIESTGGFELGIELVVKARRLGKKIVEVPTIWRDRVAGKSNFKLWRWMPSYLRWFFYAFK
jgi:hypothetical protein